MGSGGATQSSSSTKDVPAWAQPFAVEGLHTAVNATMRGNPANPYPQQHVSEMTPQQTQGLQMAQNRAVAGSPVMNAAQTNLQDTLNGKYLDIGTNPAWAPMAQRITDAYSTGTAAQTDAAAARANALGGSAYGEQVGYNQRALGDSLAGAAGNIYNDERNHQMQANLFAPQAAQADYQDAQALLGVGDTYRQYNQDIMNNNYQNQYQQANWPFQRIDMMGNYLNQFTGGAGQATSTNPNPYQPNRAAGALGGAASGAALGSMVGPWGTAIGGLVGGIGGALM